MIDTNMDGGIAVMLIIATITAGRLTTKWVSHRLDLQKEKLLMSKKDQQEGPDVRVLKDRLENLEALVCRLDSERSIQMERSIRLLSGSGLNKPGVSQMPTTFMNVATALEGRYQILRELGRGGMGIVFQAHDKDLNEQVAIKVLSPLLGSDPDALERLKREVSSARRITHPNVIRIHDISERNGLHFVSMEFFQGMNLKDYIRKSGNLSQMQALSIALQVCDGLEAAHRQGVIHRDLKSQNILINTSNQVKIIDFGLARAGNLEGMTATGLIMGTPEYMAPEQVTGNRVDERADIYSLGIILYELFTGHVPFTGNSAIAVGFKQVKEDPQQPCDINPQLSSEVQRVILKALQKDPYARHASVTELKVDLERAMKQPPPGAVEERWSDRQHERIHTKT